VALAIPSGRNFKILILALITLIKKRVKGKIPLGPTIDFLKSDFNFKTNFPVSPREEK